MKSISPALEAQAVDISSVDHAFPKPCNAIYVGGTGVIIVEMGNVAGGVVNVTFSAVPAGYQLNVAATKVIKTGTTATLMVGMFS